MNASEQATPRVSVLVCTRNRPQQVARCVATILESPLRDFELLVIDQSTSDATATALAAIDDARLRLLRTPTKGLSRSRNIGIQASRAPIVLFTDDDCLAEPTWVEAVLAAFEAHPEVDAVYGRVKPYGQAPGPQGWICPTVIDDADERFVEKLRTSTHEALGHGNNMAFRRRCFERHGLYHEWLGAGTPMRGGEDTDFTFRLLRRGARVMYSPRPLVHHDNWMRLEDSDAQLAGYKKSSAVVFVRFLLGGSLAAGRVLLWIFKSHLKDWWGSVKWKNRKGARHHLSMLCCLTWGTVLGVAFALRRPPRYLPDERRHPWTEVAAGAAAQAGPGQERARASTS
jgi:GT2 family glycosyltransferase